MLSSKTPLGFPSSQSGAARRPFPAAVPVTRLGPISDALVGRIPWLSPTVHVDLDILFGQDRAKVTEYIQRWRQRARSKFLELHKSIKSATW
ncbi:hypothetical protein N7528_004141 [Penicillium herquei]|nr:hypothetical protein N7528_004141 [Penicillium herquei]